MNKHRPSSVRHTYPHKLPHTQSLEQTDYNHTHTHVLASELSSSSSYSNWPQVRQQINPGSINGTGGSMFRFEQIHSSTLDWVECRRQVQKRRKSLKFSHSMNTNHFSQTWPITCVRESRSNIAV